MQAIFENEMVSNHLFLNLPLGPAVLCVPPVFEGAPLLLDPRDGVFWHPLKLPVQVPNTQHEQVLVIQTRLQWVAACDVGWRVVSIKAMKLTCTDAVSVALDNILCETDDTEGIAWGTGGGWDMGKTTAEASPPPQQPAPKCPRSMSNMSVGSKEVPLRSSGISSLLACMWTCSSESPFPSK